MHLDYIEVKECIQKKNKLKTLIKQTEQDLMRNKLLLNRFLEGHSNEFRMCLSINIDSIYKLFYTILGSKEKQFEKEIQETLKSKLRYDECKHNVNYLVEESKKLVDEMSQLANCSEIEYEGLIEKRIENISNDDSSKCEKLKKLIKRKYNLSSNIMEVDEAIEVGEKALILVEKTIKSLEKVENWGDWSKKEQLIDAEYSDIDEAVNYAEEAQRLLGNLKREISDINMITNAEVTVSYLESFSDKFYDSLIYDFIMLSEIGRTLDILKNTKNQIDKTMSKLYEEKVTDEFLYNQTEEQINNLVKSN